MSQGYTGSREDQINLSGTIVGSSTDLEYARESYPIEGRLSDLLMSDAVEFHLRETVHSYSMVTLEGDIIISYSESAESSEGAGSSIEPVMVIQAKTPFQLDQEIQQLRQQVKDLQAQLEKPQKSASPFEEKVIVLREISRQEAKDEILALFKDGDTHDYGEIAERLRLDLQQVVDICNELEKEGVIG